MALNILFLTYAYPPFRSPRSIQISRLVKFSQHKTHVVCSSGYGANDSTITGTMRGKPDKLTVIDRGNFPRHHPRYILSKLMALPDHCKAWAMAATETVLSSKWHMSHDALVTFGQPMSDHLAGIEIKRATGIPWIAHFSDPWTDSPYRTRFPLIAGLNQRMEEQVIRTADRVVFTSFQTSNLVMRKYPSAWGKKVAILPHAYDSGLYSSELGNKERGVIRHIGNFYQHRTPSCFLRSVLCLYRNSPDILHGIRVEFIGKTTFNFSTRKIVNALPAGLVRVCDPVSYADSLSLMQASEILLLIDAPAKENVFLPSKLIDYVGARRPIFAITPPGASADLVRQLGGWVVDPEDESGIVEMLMKAIKEIHKTTNPDWGSARVRSQYEASQVTKKFDQLIASVLNT